jgi:hypothetical protein
MTDIVLQYEGDEVTHHFAGEVGGYQHNEVYLTYIYVGGEAESWPLEDVLRPLCGKKVAVEMKVRVLDV